MQSPRPLKSAWLITWEGIGAHARTDKRGGVVAILNCRWTGQKVREFVEQFYIALTCGAWDKLALAHDKRSNPYPALFGTIRGIPWSGEVICGHNPWLHARGVRNLRVTINDDNTQASWEDVPRPEVP
jgi:hypothetical protein